MRVTTYLERHNIKQRKTKLLTKNVHVSFLSKSWRCMVGIVVHVLRNMMSSGKRGEVDFERREVVLSTRRNTDFGVVS